MKEAFYPNQRLNSLKDKVNSYNTINQKKAQQPLMQITKEQIRKAAEQVAEKSGLENVWKKWLINQITIEMLQETSNTHKQEVIRIKVADIPDDEFARFRNSQ